MASISSASFFMGSLLWGLVHEFIGSTEKSKASIVNCNSVGFTSEKSEGSPEQTVNDTAVAHQECGKDCGQVHGAIAVFGRRDYHTATGDCKRRGGHAGFIVRGYP